MEYTTFWTTSSSTSLRVGVHTRMFTQAEGADDVLSFPLPPPIIGERYTRYYVRGNRRRLCFQLVSRSLHPRWTNIAARCTSASCTHNVTKKDVPWEWARTEQMLRAWTLNQLVPLNGSVTWLSVINTNHKGLSTYVQTSLSLFWIRFHWHRGSPIRQVLSFVLLLIRNLKRKSFDIYYF